MVVGVSATSFMAELDDWKAGGDGGVPAIVRISPSGAASKRDWRSPTRRMRQRGGFIARCSPSGAPVAANNAAATGAATAGRRAFSCAACRRCRRRARGGARRRAAARSAGDASGMAAAPRAFAAGGRLARGGATRRGAPACPIPLMARAYPAIRASPAHARARPKDQRLPAFKSKSRAGLSPVLRNLRDF